MSLCSLQSVSAYFQNEHLLNSEWFRSAALNTWPTARYRRAVVSLVDAVGDVKASFEFDLVGAQRNNWFTLQRLRSASPWTAREIRASNPKNFRIGQWVTNFKWYSRTKRRWMFGAIWHVYTATCTFFKIIVNDTYNVRNIHRQIAIYMYILLFDSKPLYL